MAGGPTARRLTGQVQRIDRDGDLAPPSHRATSLRSQEGGDGQQALVQPRHRDGRCGAAAACPLPAGSPPTTPILGVTGLIPRDMLTKTLGMSSDSPSFLVSRICKRMKVCDAHVQRIFAFRDKARGAPRAPRHPAQTVALTNVSSAAFAAVCPASCGSMYEMSHQPPGRLAAAPFPGKQRPAVAAGRSAKEVMTGDQTTPYGLRPGRSHSLLTGRSLAHKGENPGSRAYHGAVTAGGSPRMTAGMQSFAFPSCQPGAGATDD
jgi:hypothetical protein